MSQFEGDFVCVSCAMQCVRLGLIYASNRASTASIRWNFRTSDHNDSSTYVAGKQAALDTFS
jgi:hypothetical protein